MGRALYRKYRPRSLDEVVGQKHITDTLSRAIKSGKISHAYLLTGPRGTGKTSIARILAHQLNNLDYSADQAHLDIIEIDAASNRRIDEIRDLRDKVHILPTSNKYKVYIIDEVHMLTREAFNALLKTLEEPPEHVIFILATTEAHKLPETIISRTQHFAFKPVESSKVVEHLKSIVKGEKLSIDDAALELVAEHGGGSFRDSISLLDQVRSLGDKVNAKDVERLLGIAPLDLTNQLLLAIDSSDVAATLDKLSELRGEGYQSGMLAKQLGNEVRKRVLKDTSHQNTHSLKLLGDLLSVNTSNHPDRSLEIALLDYVFSQNPTANNLPVSQPTISVKPETKQPAVSEKIIVEDEVPIKPKDTPKIKDPLEDSREDSKEGTSKPIAAKEQAGGDGFTIEAWPVVVAAIKKKYNTLYGILRMAEPKLEDNELTLIFQFAFHQKQINNSKYRTIIGDIIKEQTGQNIEIKCIVGKASDKQSGNGTKNNIVNNVSDIFGGAEVLES